MLPPKETAEPLIVTEEFASLLFAIDPASISFVTVLFGKTTVPVKVGEAFGDYVVPAVDEASLSFS